MDREQIIETDVFDLLKAVPYVQSEEELAIEKCILDYKRLSLDIDEASNEALSMVLQDIYMGDFAERVKGRAAATVQKIKDSSGAFGNFIRKIQTSLTSKIVNEKFIIKRFNSVKMRYIVYFDNKDADQRGYITVPSYATMIQRLNGLHNCIEYLRKAVASEDINATIGDETYAKMVELASGALSVKESSSGVVMNLVWQAPVLEDIILKESPFIKEANIDNLCNTVLYVKYKSMEGIQGLVDNCLARSKKFSKMSSWFTPNNITDENADLYMRNYGSAYMLSKILNDVMKQGIQREINTLAINYVHKLKDIHHW